MGTAKEMAGYVNCASQFFPAPLSDSADSLQVSFYTLVPPLASSMMAPGLPEVAEKYGITSSTVVALTLSSFLLTFGTGVR